MRWNRASCCDQYDGNVNGNWDNKMIRIYQRRESHCRTNISVRRNKSKRAGLWESQSGIRKETIWKVNHLSKVIWGRKIITEFIRCISSTRIAKPVVMMDIKVSNNKIISKWVDWENLIYDKSNSIKNHAQRQRR